MSALRTLHDKFYGFLEINQVAVSKWRGASEKGIPTRTKDKRFGCGSSGVVSYILGEVKERYSDTPN
jgi:hypothetical protein